MRQRVVWFVLGVLIGSLFVVSAYPNDKGVQYGVPAVQEIAGENYTAYIFYSKSGLPIDRGELVKKIDTLLNATAPNAKWQAYAIPDLPKDVVLIGYGIKVAPDGRTESYILAARKNFLPQKNSKTELLKWAEKKPIFASKIPIGTYGPPKGWEVKISSSNGEERVLSGQVSPYWYDIGPAEMKLNYPPYGNINMKFHLYALIHDGDPQHVSFLLAPGKNGDGWYKIEPGYEIKNILGNNNYGDYITDTAKIIHDWNLDPAFEPEIETAEPLEILGGHRDITISIGYPPSLSFTVTIPDSYMFPAEDSSTQKAGWLLEFNTYSGDAMYAFYTNVYSTAKVKQSALLDGHWHKIVKVNFEAVFIKQDDYEHTHEAIMTLTWNLKVG
ncbi:hypothetical protein [Thermococcus sp.]|uniref:hypothetical protein n=1 Tax=Thermococcus sp. TaxID=35749 RepID=UPI00262DE990|nr:hypothetical protein [Thermococcus sp.]